MNKVYLESPDIKFEKQFLEMVDEWQEPEEEKFAEAIEDFSKYVQKLQDGANGINLPDGIVPSSHYWLMDSHGRIVGRSCIRHHLVPRLEKEGGHIGYSISPSQRRKGYGTEILRLTLEKAVKFGLSKILITCDKDNIGSHRIIEKNGGVKLNEVISDISCKIVERFEISL